MVALTGTTLFVVTGAYLTFFRGPKPLPATFCGPARRSSD